MYLPGFPQTRRSTTPEPWRPLPIDHRNSLRALQDLQGEIHQRELTLKKLKNHLTDQVSRLQVEEALLEKMQGELVRSRRQNAVSSDNGGEPISDPTQMF